MRFNSLEELINHIWNNIMNSDYDRYIKMSFGENDILMFVFEYEISIRIAYH